MYFDILHIVKELVVFGIVINVSESRSKEYIDSESNSVG